VRSSSEDPYRDKRDIRAPAMTGGPDIRTGVHTLDIDIRRLALLPHSISQRILISGFAIDHIHQRRAAPESAEVLAE
jgi:hypothetical protein